MEADEAPRVERKHRTMILYVRPGTDTGKKKVILDHWYREQLKIAAPSVIARWEGIMGVEVERLFVQQMKTKWGSCNPAAKSIRLNTDLAKKPSDCLEYIIVHEMAHLLEPTHNSRFVAFMDKFMPKWQLLRDHLNRLPVSHIGWRY